MEDLYGPKWRCESLYPKIVAEGWGDIRPCDFIMMLYGRITVEVM